jgi:hypothetical protein
MRGTTKAEIRSVLAEALFASALQPSESPMPAQIRQAIRTSIIRYTALGCAKVVAQEYGEHPLEAMHRMRWVLAALNTAHPQHFRTCDLRLHSLAS